MIEIHIYIYDGISFAGMAVLTNGKVVSTTHLGYIGLWDPSPIKLLSHRKQTKLLKAVLNNKSVTTLDLLGVNLNAVVKYNPNSVRQLRALDLLCEIVSFHPKLTTLIFDTRGMRQMEVKELLIDIFQNRKITHLQVDGYVFIRDGNIIGSAFNPQFKTDLLKTIEARGIACLTKGDYQEAVVWLEMIMRIDPKCNVAWSVLDNIKMPFKICTDNYYANTSFTYPSKRTARWKLMIAAEDDNKTHLQQLCDCLEQLFTLKFHETSVLAVENKFGERIIPSIPNTPEEKLLDDLLMGWELIINKTDAKQKVLIEALVGQYKTHHDGGYWFKVGPKEANRILRLLKESIGLLSPAELLSLIDNIESAIVSDASHPEGALWQGKPRVHQGLGICPDLKSGLNALKSRLSPSENKPSPLVPSLPEKTLLRRKVVRHPVAPDGDCGYTAFGITRENAHQLLKDYKDQSIIQKLLRPVLEEILFVESFIEYAQQKKVLNQGLLKAFTGYQTYAEVGGDMPQKVVDTLKSYAVDRALLEAYIEYDILDKQIDNGWAHPCILQALAHVQGIHLRLFQLDDQKTLISHQQYPEYRSPHAQEAKDLLFINRNHFELLEFVDQQDEMLPHLLPRKTEVSTPIKVIKEPIPLLLSDSHKASNIFHYHLAAKLSIFQTNSEVAYMEYFQGKETGRWENIKAFSKATVKFIVSLTGPVGAILQATGVFIIEGGNAIAEGAKSLFELAEQSLEAASAGSEMVEIACPQEDKTFLDSLEERIRVLVGEQKTTKKDQLKQFATVFAGTFGTKALERFIQGLLWRYHEQLALLSEDGGMQLAEVVENHLYNLFQLDFIDWQSHDIHYELEGQGQEQQSRMLKVMWYWVDRVNFLMKKEISLLAKGVVEATVLIQHSGYQCLSEKNEVLYLDIKQSNLEEEGKFFETQGQQWGYRRVGLDEGILEPFARELEEYREKNCLNPTGKFTLQTLQRYRDYEPPITDIKSVPFTWKSDSEEIVVLKSEVKILCKENEGLRNDVKDAKSDAATAKKKADIASKVAQEATEKFDVFSKILLPTLQPEVQTQIREGLDAVEKKHNKKDKFNAETKAQDNIEPTDTMKTNEQIVLDTPIETETANAGVNLAAPYQPLFHAPAAQQENHVENQAAETIEEPSALPTKKKEDETKPTLN